MSSHVKCGQCGKIVKVNKPVLGALHLCDPDPEPVAKSRERARQAYQQYYDTIDHRYSFWKWVPHRPEWSGQTCRKCGDVEIIGFEKDEHGWWFRISHPARKVERD